jgi:hypothetical protein
MSIVLAIAIVLVTSTSALAAADLAKRVFAMEAAWASVHAYTARFVRQERIDDTLRPREEAELKFQRPGRLYLRWTDGEPKGREILYVPGRDDDKLLVREPGLVSGLFTLVLAPDSPRVLRESRHPVTDIGIGRLVERITGDVRKGLRAGELVLTDHGEAKERAGVSRIEISVAAGASGHYYAPRVLVDIDRMSALPVGLAAFDGDGRIVGRYEYHEVRLNVALGDIDFDAANPRYEFPRRRLSL